MHLLDHVHEEPESEIQEEQVQEDIVVHKHQVVWVLTLCVSKANPGASHHNLDFLFWINTLEKVCLCIKFVGIDLDRSCITLPSWLSLITLLAITRH
jgi:hypothetical protein